MADAPKQPTPPPYGGVDTGWGQGYPNLTNPAEVAPLPPDAPAVEQEIVIGNTPGSATGSVPPRPGQIYHVSVATNREYVSGGTYTWYANLIRSLPFAIDDITKDFGDDLYERMLYDPQVAACLNTLKAAIMAEGVHLIPAMDDEPNESDTQAIEMVKFCQRVLDALTIPLEDVLWNLLDALAFGNKVAEQVYKIAEDGPDKGKLILRALKVKPRRTLSFVVNVYMDVIGLLALVPGMGAPVQTGTILSEPGHIPNLLPPKKFAILTFRPRDGDPRGQSILRPAYNAWWLKTQVWPEYLKYLTQFASPTLIGSTPPEADAAPQLDTNGNVVGTAIVTPEQSMLGALQGMKNGTVIVVPYGAKVDPLEMQGVGEPFIEALKLFDHQITKAILSQTLATEESQHQTRAAASVHQDVLGLIIRQGKAAVERLIRRDILLPLLEYNYGTKAMARLPIVSLGDVEQQDLADLMQGVAALARANYFDESQLPGMDILFNFPNRDTENPRPLMANAHPYDVTPGSRSADAEATAPKTKNLSGGMGVRTPRSSTRNYSRSVGRAPARSVG